MNLTSLLNDYRKRKTIRLYLMKLRPILGRRFGKKEYYAPDEVVQAAYEANLPVDSLCYGLAIYCTLEDFDAYYAEKDEKSYYWETRQEVADRHFGGNSGFTPDDVLSYVRSNYETGGTSGEIHHLGGEGSGHSHHGHH